MEDALRAWREADPSGPPALRWVQGEPPRPFALLLGAFDPPTRAHVALCEGAARALGMPAAFCVTKVLLGRRGRLLSDEDRLRLLDALARCRGLGLAVANRGTYLEVARAAGPQAVFVVGSDKLAQLADPSFYPDGQAGVEATFREVRLCVVRRPGYPVTREDVAVLEAEAVFDDPALAQVSGAEVRRRLAAGEDATDLVPPLVASVLARYTGRADSR